MKNIFLILGLLSMQTVFAQEHIDAEPKKQNVEVFANYYFTTLKSGDSEFKSPYSFSARDYSKPFEVGEVFYFQKQLYKVKHNFIANTNADLGILLSKQIVSKISIKYGMGINYFNLKYTNKIDTSRINTIKATVNSVGTSEPNNNITYEFLDRDEFATQQEYNQIKASTIYSLLLPLGIEYTISNKFSGGLKWHITIPIAATSTAPETKNIVVVPTPFPTITTEEKYNTTIFYNNFFVNGGVYVKYKIDNETSIQLSYNNSYNSLMRDLSNTTFERSFANAKKVNVSSFGVGLVYRF